MIVNEIYQPNRTASVLSVDKDLIVYGGTEAGVVCAVQAARLGMVTALVSESSYLFGFFPSLGAWETHYPGVREPLSEEIRQKIISHYRNTYGEGSAEFRTCVHLDSNNPMVTFEPHVAEATLQELIEREEKLQVYAPLHLVEVSQKDGRIEAVIFERDDRKRVKFAADTVIDCSYTGDLAAAAGLKYRLGRESREEFSEPHAGRIFTTWKEGRYPREAVEGKLNLLPTWTTGELLPESTGAGDRRIQDYSCRLCLSSDPDNQIHPDMPDGYDRSRYLAIVEPPEVKESKHYPLHHRWLTHSLEEMVKRDHLFHGHELPRNKRSWNATNFTGAANGYPESGPQERKAIEKAHFNHSLGLLYFLQNDEAMSAKFKRMARQWGLAKDEFREHNHLPPSIYLREGRRFEGAYIYREQDCLVHPELSRAPIHHDGIAFTDFALDSLPCSTDRVNGSLPEGQFFEKDRTRPGSMPFRCMIPNGLANLLVPTAPSVTHCAWGTVRQTTCLLHFAAVCAHAAHLAHACRESVGALPADKLQIHLAKNRLMISFFNDFDMRNTAPWVPAVQFLATRGFFWSYDAAPEAPLTWGTAVAWIEAFKSWMKNPPPDPNAIARAVREAEEKGDRSDLSPNEFDLLWNGRPTADGRASIISPTRPISRGAAATAFFEEYIERSERKLLV